MSDLKALLEEQTRAQVAWEQLMMQNVVNISLEERIQKDIANEEARQRLNAARQKYADAIRKAVNHD